MSHELTIREDGFVEMAYVGETPWHKLGNVLQPGASKEQWRKAAGYDFTVARAPVTYSFGGREHQAPDRFVLCRSDNNAFLSIVSSKFKIVQPQDVMDYFDELAQKAGFQLETAGTLFGGRQYWALANIGDEACVADKRDRIKGRLLMATAVDGSQSVVKFLAERVVCNNTLTFGMAERGGTQVRVRHDRHFNAADVNAKLGITLHERFAETMSVFRRMAETPMTELQSTNASIALLFPSAAQAAQEELDRIVSHHAVERIAELAITGEAIGGELDGARGTAWGWLNSVTQFVDHESRAHTADGRLARAWFGAGERIKQNAFEMASAHADDEPRWWR